MRDLSDRRLYLCTPDRTDLARFLEACIGGGVDVVQLRDKGLDDRSMLRRARLALELCRDLGVPFILNDRPDLALEVGADGVHVGQDDVAPTLCRRILGGQAIVGLSTHGPAQWEAGRAEPVDYLAVGPVLPTATHPDRPAAGLDLIRYCARSHEARPWFVTGGVSPATVPSLAAAGGTRFVVVRSLTEAADPLAAATDLNSAINASSAASSLAAQAPFPLGISTPVDLPGDLPVIERRVVRVVVLDVDRRVLLFRIREPLHPEQGTIWELPGGGIDAGETYVDAALRELREETGIRATPGDVGAPGWRRRATFLHAGTRRLQDEIVVLVQVKGPGPAVDTTHQLPQEMETYCGFRWWALDEIESSAERFYPTKLPTLLRCFLAGDQIDEPFEYLS